MGIKLDSISFGNEVYMEYFGRTLCGDIPSGTEGVVLGFFNDGFHSVWVAGSTQLDSRPKERYEGDVGQRVDQLMEDPKVIGIAVLDRAIIDHLAKTGTFEARGATPIWYTRNGRTYHVF